MHFLKNCTFKKIKMNFFFYRVDEALMSQFGLNYVVTFYLAQSDRIKWLLLCYTFSRKFIEFFNCNFFYRKRLKFRQKTLIHAL